MMKNSFLKTTASRSRISKAISLLEILCLMLLPLTAATAEGAQEDWVTFFLMCNEGMRNDGDNVGNTLMVISMNPEEGRIKQLMFTWDTFVDYTGYDTPQLLDKPFRVNGPAETMKVFNENFGQNIETYMSVNYLNLAEMINQYGGVEVDVTRAERNALNGMLTGKANTLSAAGSAFPQLQGIIDDWMGDENMYLQAYGPKTHLSGMQAVAFGWLQYDSVYNCCLREVDVIADLFYRVGETIGSRVAFIGDGGHVAEDEERRVIDLNNITEDDVKYLNDQVRPIFELSYNNLSEEMITDITIAIARAAYAASVQGVNMFERLEIEVMPLEKLRPYEKVAGVEGHIIDKEANAQAITEFLFG